MEDSLAVPVETTIPPAKSWSARMQEIAFFGAQQCRSRGTVHSAICTITGSPETLVVNLACTAKWKADISELMQYVNDTLLPQMENELGVQFEAQNLQFAVAGNERLVTSPDHANETELTKNGLDHPFTSPAMISALSLRTETGEPQTDLRMV